MSESQMESDSNEEQLLPIGGVEIGSETIMDAEESDGEDEDFLRREVEEKKLEVSMVQQQQSQNQELQTFPLDQELPCMIANLSISRLQWCDFQGTPNFEQRWSAHAFWGIEYSYTVQQKTAKNKKVSYVITPEVNVQFKRKKSWTKKNDSHLLNHEQGHYVIGCFCALEFKKQVLDTKFTDNYRFEIPRLFDAILQNHIILEKRYDKETDHRLDREQQSKWDEYMLQKIREYKLFFLAPRKTKKTKIGKQLLK